MPNDYNQYQPYTGFFTRDSNTGNNQDIGQRYISKSYLLDVYPNIASQLGSRISPGLWSWGGNEHGQLGLGNTVDRSSPLQVGALTNWKQVDAGSRSPLFNINASGGVKSDGTLWTWGYNNQGQLGLGNTLRRSSPVQVGSLTNWRQVSSAGDAMLSVKVDGTLWAWGTNGSGKLGLGNTTTRSSPVQVGTLTNWKQVSINSDITACIKTDGTLWTWGSNGSGQLGQSNTISRSSPVQVGSLTNWKQVSCGQNHMLCVKTDNTLWAWGVNSTGQLGLGDTVDRSSPVQVGTLTNWKQASGGTQECSCVKTDGTLWTWGRNQLGQLGLGDTVDRSSPVQVGTLTNWKKVAFSIGYYSGTCIKTDGTLWVWGSNSTGELGLGDTVDRSSPVQVGTLTYWKQVSVGSDFMLSILDYSY